MKHYGVGDAARRLRVKPRVLSDLFYQGAFDNDRCPVVSGRRLIPADYLPTIQAELTARQ